MVWREILNAGDHRSQDPTPEKEIYGEPVVIGNGLITQLRLNFPTYDHMIEKRLRVGKQFFTILPATVCLVLEKAESVLSEQNMFFYLLFIVSLYLHCLSGLF